MAVDGIAPLSGTNSPIGTGSSSMADAGSDFARELTAAKNDEIIGYVEEIFMINYMLFNPVEDERSELADVS